MRIIRFVIINSLERIGSYLGVYVHLSAPFCPSAPGPLRDLGVNKKAFCVNTLCFEFCDLCPSKHNIVDRTSRSGGFDLEARGQEGSFIEGKLNRGETKSCRLVAMLVMGN